MALRLLVAMALLRCMTSLPQYQEKIPNGQAVPNPCIPDQVWIGVGHFNVAGGGGPLNTFGTDFQRENHTWTKSLCQADSDGDGRTNGQELGDPDCVWKVGDRTKGGMTITHPGICEPWNSTKCVVKNDTEPQTYKELMAEICKSHEFVCEGTHDEGVQQVSLTLSEKSRVPSKVTTYMCQIFDFQNMTSPGDYHLIALEPIIRNANVMHHILMFGCLDEATPSGAPYECRMVDPRCQAVIGSWTLGLPGVCFHRDTGIRVGSQGYKRVAIQLHWNNPQQLSDYMDNSGLLLYYTAKRRKFEAAVFLTGVYLFELPPLTRAIQLTSTCSGSETHAILNGPVHVTMAANHMHYTGTKMSIKLIRNETAIKNLTKYEVFKYDSPVMNYYSDNPIEILPGDELITRCEYSTLSRTTSTKSGEATDDEMCFGFLVVYPKENLDLDKCLTGQQDLGQTCLDWIGDDTKFQRSDLYKDLQKSCSDPANCSDECLQTIEKQKKQTNCLDVKIFPRIKKNLKDTHDLVKCMAACEVKFSTTTTPNPALSLAEKLSSDPNKWSRLTILISFLLAII